MIVSGGLKNTFLDGRVFMGTHVTYKAVPVFGWLSRSTFFAITYYAKSTLSHAHSNILGRALTLDLAALND